jgi:D-alanyl-D-alanine carboxypeptidase
LSLLLAGGIAAVAWHIFAAPPTEPGSVEGSSVALGLPDLKPADQKQVVPARSAVVWNKETKTIAFEQNAFERVPIASLTKLMTAMVALDYGVPWDKEVEILPREYVIGGQLLLHPGERVSMRNLLNASLLGSANNATLAYVRALGIPEEEFVQAMNRKAVELELEQTVFTDVTGLDNDNVSTAYEVARFADHAFANYPDIAQITSQPEYSFVVAGSGREHTIRNTNKLISDGGLIAFGSKTGYLYEAGYCLVTAGSGEQQDLVAVVLGSPGEDQQYQGVTWLLSNF